MKMIHAGYAIARYDSGDDYGSHPNEDRYHAAQRSTSCTGPVPVEGQTVPADLVQPEQGQTEPPFWTWAALGALAAESGLDIASFHSDDDDSNFALAATADRSPPAVTGQLSEGLTRRPSSPPPTRLPLRLRGTRLRRRTSDR